MTDKPHKVTITERGAELLSSADKQHKTATYKHPKSKQSESQEAEQEVIRLKKELKLAEQKRDRLLFLDHMANALNTDPETVKHLKLKTVVEQLQHRDLGLKLHNKFESYRSGI